MRIGAVVHLTHDDLTLTGPTPVAHIRPKEVVPGARPWRPKNGEQRAVPLSPRAVAMLRDIPRRRRWVIDRMEGTAAGVTPARGRKGISTGSARSWRSTITRCSKSLGNRLQDRACSIRRYQPNGEGGIRTRGPAFDRTRL